MTLPRIRSMRKAYDEIVANDPETSISYYHFRHLVITGVIPSVKSGQRYLLDMDNVVKAFSTQDKVTNISTDNPDVLSGLDPLV